MESSDDHRSPDSQTQDERAMRAETTMTSRRRHPAQASRILATGLSTATLLGIVAVLGAQPPADAPEEPAGIAPARVTVVIGDPEPTVRPAGDRPADSPADRPAGDPPADRPATRHQHPAQLTHRTMTATEPRTSGHPHLAAAVPDRPAGGWRPAGSRPWAPRSSCSRSTPPAARPPAAGLQTWRHAGAASAPTARSASQPRRRTAGRGLPETLTLLALAVLGWRATGGRFDPRSLTRWRRPATTAASTSSQPPDPAPMAQGRPRDPLPAWPGSGSTPRAGMVTLPPGIRLDPGGIAKGFAADLLCADLRAAGAAGVCVNVGGDLRVSGAPHPRAAHGRSPSPTPTAAMRPPSSSATAPPPAHLSGGPGRSAAGRLIT